MSIQASLERRSIIKTLTPKARDRIKTIFNAEIKGLESILGFKVPDWDINC